jgi:hypothetical protein
MSTTSHSIEIAAPAVGRRKGTTKSLRDLVVAQLDHQLVPSQAGVTTREAGKSHSGIVKSITVTFNYQDEGGK